MLPTLRGLGLVAVLCASSSCETLPAAELERRPVIGPFEPLAGAAAPSSEPQPEQLAVAPATLSETGLFADTPSQLLAAGIENYQPVYELWSDGAQKRRWVRLPPGTQIDTSDMDRWSLPTGTKIWKEFGRDQRALETRYMAKFGPNPQDWVFMSYQWNNAGTEAHAVPYGVIDAAGTTHDIPSAELCLACHNSRPLAALGFSAIQLSHSGPGLTLAGLVAAGRLSAPPATELRVPGDPVSERALGYLHANCGSCHNSTSAPAFGAYADVVFALSASQLASVEQTTTYVHLVANKNGDLRRLRSGLERMRSRPARPMPPVAAEEVDPNGVALVEAWLQQLGAFP